MIILPPFIKGGGGKYLPNGRGVIIEGSSSRLGSMRTLEIILHEYIHSNFETKNYDGLLEESLKDLREQEMELQKFFSRFTSKIVRDQFHHYTTTTAKILSSPEKWIIPIPYFTAKNREFVGFLRFPKL